MTIGGNVVGNMKHQQSSPLTDSLIGLILPDCGHIIPEDQLEASLSALLPFVA